MPGVLEGTLCSCAGDMRGVGPHPNLLQEDDVLFKARPVKGAGFFEPMLHQAVARVSSPGSLPHCYVGAILQCTWVSNALDITALPLALATILYCEVIDDQTAADSWQDQLGACLSRAARCLETNSSPQQLRVMMRSSFIFMQLDPRQGDAAL